MTYPEYYYPPNIPTSGWDSIVLFSTTPPRLRRFRELYGVAFTINPTTVYYLEHRGLIYSLPLSCPVWDTLVDINSRTVGRTRLVLDPICGPGKGYDPRTTVFTCKTLLELHDYIQRLQLMEGL